MLVSHEQTTYVCLLQTTNCLRLIYDIIEVTKRKRWAHKRFLCILGNIPKIHTQVLGKLLVLLLAFQKKKSIMKLIVKRIRIRDLLKIGNPFPS